MAAAVMPKDCDVCGDALSAKVHRIRFQYTAQRTDGSTKQVNEALHFCAHCSAHMLKSSPTAAPVNSSVAAAAAATTTSKNKGMGAGLDTVDVTGSANATADMWIARLFGKMSQRVDPETKAFFESMYNENTVPTSFEMLMRREARFVTGTAVAKSEKNADGEKQARGTLLGSLPQQAGELMAKRVQSKPELADRMRETLASVNTQWLTHIDAVFAQMGSTTASKMPKPPTGDELLALANDGLGPLSTANSERFSQAVQAHVKSTHAAIMGFADPDKRDYLTAPLVRKAIEDALRVGAELDRLTGGRTA